ncbi:hypothetical protein Z517_01720 [Fonsecaea pedrosoi CBS 271.37]|uniref:Histone chaperone domain-containing protein n=1 Tax=Fonsecaea pedrosoi CBS 271.37 TaxID=1442368 RepID=A0A0D2HPD4_9EURO|nr:uncharacterized protein Z517_01720 [Fonsecaea pedrosoi CBS 271.37]KIW86324.1 hypothetical protein Z517_01720 [Fonsecaea pedrosoi CBS 271.37]
MPDQKESRPAKQRRTHGTPLLDQSSPIEDDEDSSSSSSSSSVRLPTSRLAHRLLKHTNPPPTERSAGDGQSGDEDEDDETTSSSDSEDSDSEESSEEEDQDSEDEAEDENEGVEDHLDASDSGVPQFTTLPAPASDLKSRLQSFLPQLRQANAELDNGGGVVDRRIDHVSDEEEHYIEMEVGLGVLSEEKSDATQIRLPRSPSGENELDQDEIKDGPEDSQTGVSRLLGTNGTKGTKRKIEEL